jgi:hypothetical protein
MLFIKKRPNSIFLKTILLSQVTELQILAFFSPKNHPKLLYCVYKYREKHPLLIPGKIPPFGSFYFVYF